MFQCYRIPGKISRPDYRWIFSTIYDMLTLNSLYLNLPLYFAERNAMSSKVPPDVTTDLLPVARETKRLKDGAYSMFFGMNAAVGAGILSTGISVIDGLFTGPEMALSAGLTVCFGWLGRNGSLGLELPAQLRKINPRLTIPKGHKSWTLKPRRTHLGLVPKIPVKEMNGNYSSVEGQWEDVYLVTDLLGVHIERIEYEANLTKWDKSMKQIQKVYGIWDTRPTAKIMEM